MDRLKNIDTIFNPRAIAVIGASRSPLKWGHIILGNIISGGYKGEIYPINPRESRIFGLKVYPDVGSIPDEVDLAVIATPSSIVPKVMEECVSKRVGAVVIISGGFSETGTQGAQLEQEVVRIAQRGWVLLVGPNTMGAFSASTSLYALMPPVRPKGGHIGFVSQSGNLGTQMLRYGQVQGVGFSKYVSSGNEGDLHCEDYIEYFGQDQETKVILAYIEGLDDGRRFLEIARKVSARKPIVAFKAGRTKSGARAAKSHSGALAGSSQIYDAVFRQAGIIKAFTTEEMLDLARAFVSLPLPKGKRVGILTWGGGWGVVAADACEYFGLEVPHLSSESIQELDKILPPYWSRGNPVDLVGVLDRASHLKCLEILAGCERVDGIIALGTITGTSFFDSVIGAISKISAEKGERIKKGVEKADKNFADKIIELMARFKKPIISVTMTPETGVETETLGGILTFSTPERAARVLAKLFEYSRYSDR